MEGKREIEGNNSAKGRKGQTPGPTTKKVDLYVVVADDDVDDHRLITKAVKDCDGNHLVTSVYNGVQLMNLLLRRGFYKVESERLPDVIILDLRMPVMDGHAALREIKSNESLKDIPIFVLSDALDENEVERLSQMGVAKMYDKPFTYEELKQLMYDICAQGIHLAASRRSPQG